MGDRVLRLVNAQTGETLARKEAGANNPIHACRCQRLGLTAVGYHKGGVVVYDDSMRSVHKISHTSPVRALAFMYARSKMVSADNAGFIQLYDFNTETVLKDKRLNSLIHCVCLSPDDQSLIVSSSDGLTVLDTAHLSTQTSLYGHSGEVSCMCVLPKQLILLSGSSDTTIRVWSLTAFTCQHTLGNHRSKVNCIGASADGSVFASAGNDFKVIIWDASSFEPRNSITCSNCITSLTFTFEPNIVLADVLGSGVYGYSTKTGGVVRTYIGKEKSESARWVLCFGIPSDSHADYTITHLLSVADFIKKHSDIGQHSAPKSKAVTAPPTQSAASLPIESSSRQRQTAQTDEDIKPLLPTMTVQSSNRPTHPSFDRSVASSREHSTQPSAYSDQAQARESRNTAVCSCIYVCLCYI